MTRTQIRPTTYRGRAGFLIIGYDVPRTAYPGARIFTETRRSADVIAGKVRQGEQTTMADFTIGKEEAARG